MRSELHIQAALRNQRTFLKSTYHTTPFKIADITEDRTQNTLRLMIMNSSPGILDGDDYQIKIDVAEGSSLNTGNAILSTVVQHEKRRFAATGSKNGKRFFNLLSASPNSTS
jgi:hypothetical protein